MTNEDEYLRSISKRPTWQRPDRTVKLADVAKAVLEERISPQQSRFHEVSLIWNQLLPAEFQEHCEITDISGGQLKILVDSPAYTHELRLCTPQLLEALQSQCPRARIKTIKVTVG